MLHPRDQFMKDMPMKKMIAAIVLVLAQSGVALAQRGPAGGNDSGFDSGFDPAAERVRVAPDEEPGEGEPMISFGVFSEPIELTTLIDYVGSALDVNIVVKGAPTGEIVFNAPVRVPRSRLIDLLDAMLEQYSYTISYEPDSKFYIVQPIADIKPVFGSVKATTRIIPTPNIKPSLLVPALSAMLGGPGTGNNNAPNAIQAVDELSVLIINAPSRDIRRVEEMVEKLIQIDKDQQYIRFELDHLAAPTALNRLVGLVGGSSSQTASIPQQGRGNNNNGQNIAAVMVTGGTLSNIAERITIDPQGNALIFKGTEDEIGRVRTLLEVIDVPNTLSPKNYFAGSSAAQIADIAKRRGLGEVVQIESATAQPGFGNFGNQNNQFNQQTSDLGLGGPVMVVDPSRGNIIYYGTVDQQAQLSALLTELKTEDERVVIREYILNHSDALAIADLLNGIISGELQTGQTDLLPGSSGRGSSRAFINGIPVYQDNESSGDFDPDKIAVIPDEDSNQIIIKAPIKQQEELEKLIGRLDRQRAQVYIQAMIVSIADNDDFTLAFETQIMAGQFGLGTNFGLSSPGASFQDPRMVSTGLSGLTAAVIKSDYVPLIINATDTKTDVRILSTPQLLVNDNEESEIVSVSEQPFTQETPVNGGSVSSFGGFAEAGTTLRITPSISDGGFMRLEYYVELSNFTSATSTISGSPPPRDRNTLQGTATVPSNGTIVIGGITVEDARDTVVKVPLLGDIPLVGELFKRTNKVDNKSKLYVFLTPRIMTDPNFNDLKLFSKGPQGEMGIDDGYPELQPAIITSPGSATMGGMPVMRPNPYDAMPADEPVDEPVDRIPSERGGVTPINPASAPALEPAFIDPQDGPAGESD